MRINAYLSLAGVASRRKADELIKAGLVSINGKTATLNATVNAGDKVEVNNKAVKAQQMRYIILNKPEGYITSMDDPEGRPKVTDLIKLPQRLKPVGRLDFNTSGLLLLTNDGQLAYKLTHPSREFVKTYQARVNGEITDKILNMLSIGVELEDGKTAPAKAVQTGKNVISLSIHEGRNRQIRRMMDAVGLKLKKLHRSSYGPLELEGLSAGAWRELSAKELTELNMMVDAKINTNGEDKDKNW